MSLTDLLLDDTGDLLLAEHPDGEVDLVAWTGAETVMQSIIVRLRIGKGSIWYNRSAGIDHIRLFFGQALSKFRESLIPIARSVYRSAVLEVDGVQGFETELINGVERERDIQFEIDDQTRSVKPVIPCVVIDCENSLVRGVVPSELLPVVAQ